MLSPLGQRGELRGVDNAAAEIVVEVSGDGEGVGADGAVDGREELVSRVTTPRSMDGNDVERKKVVAPHLKMPIQILRAIPAQERTMPWFGHKRSSTKASHPTGHLNVSTSAKQRDRI